MNNKFLIQSYVGGWVESDKKKILSVLSEACVIIESHGPTYNGKDSVSKWVDSWLEEGSVDRWKIVSYNEVDEKAFFEWIFECSYKNKRHRIEGISLVKFEDDKIVYIREYRTTKERFII